MAELVGDVTIRRAEPADASGIARVHVSSWQQAYTGIVPDSYLASLDVAQREQRWQSILAEAARSAAKTWIAVAEPDDIQGFVSFGPSRDEDAERNTHEIYAIYVQPDAWGRGVARDLMRTVLAEGATDPITLWVLAANDRARHFYRRHGFSPDGTERMESFGDAELLEVRYRHD